MWISPLEVQKLAVGTSIFSCCEHNHKVIKTCRRSVARVMLMNLVDSRSQSLFAEKKFAEARLMMSFSKWWTRGLFDDSHVSSVLFSYVLSACNIHHTHTHTLQHLNPTTIQAQRYKSNET